MVRYLGLVRANDKTPHTLVTMTDLYLGVKIVLLSSPFQYTNNLKCVEKESGNTLLLRCSTLELDLVEEGNLVLAPELARIRVEILVWTPECAG